MRLLLDSNIVVWILQDVRRLRPDVRRMISDTRNQTYMSTASALEIAAKAASGRLVFTDPMREAVEEAYEMLPVSAAHAFRVQTLPPIHKDPFDRVIVAQAMIEGMTLVTGDRRLLDYGVPIILT